MQRRKVHNESHKLIKHRFDYEKIETNWNDNIIMLDDFFNFVMLKRYFRIEMLNGMGFKKTCVTKLLTYHSFELFPYEHHPLQLLGISAQLELVLLQIIHYIIFSN